MPDEPMVHVIDDDDAVRDSLEFMLDAAGLRVRCWESAVAFLEALDRLDHGCIVTDVRMPEMTGLELVRRLKDRGIAAPVIVITGHADVPLAVEAMKAGVVDFIEKPFENQRLLGAIRAAMEARREGPDGAEKSDELRKIAERISSLSTRERQVLEALVEGRANKVIAYDLGISPRTVDRHRENILAKLGMRDRVELTRYAIRRGLIEP